MIIFLALLLGLTSVLMAQPVQVTIGEGTLTNTTTGAPSPYGTYFKNFRQQYLYTASEIDAAGGGVGNITALAFNVQNVNTCSPMPNFTIRMKHTSQTALTTTFETGTYQEVWYQNNFQPVTGWNNHVLTTPFVWDGVSNVLVDIITTLIPGDYTQNASVFYSVTGPLTSLRYQNDSVAANTALTGTTSANRANIRFTMPAITVTAPPNAAVLISPANGATTFTNPSFAWSTGGGYPAGYKLFLGTNNPPTNLLNGLDLGANTTYQHPTALAISTPYFWRVVPYNAEGDAINCPVWNFTTNTPLSGTKTIGAGGDYATFTAAINDLNANGVYTGGVTFNVAPGTYAESTPPITASGTANSPVIFQAANMANKPLVTPAGGTNTYGFKLDGAKYITFNGINVANVEGNTTLVFGYWLVGLAGSGATNNTITNCNITLAGTLTTTRGINSLGALNGANSYNTFSNNVIEGAYSAIYLTGSTTVGHEMLDVSVTGNTITNTRNYAIYIGYGLNTQVSANNISFVTGATSAFYGVYVAGPSTTTIANNIISGGSTSSTVYGIYPANGTNVIYNNVVANITNTGTSTMYGAYLTSIQNTFYNNQIYGLVAGGTNYGLYIIGGTLQNVYNNKFYNLSTTATSSYYVYGISLSGSTESNIYNNMIYDLRAPGASLAPQVRAFNVTGGTFGRIYYNTVYINASGSNANFSTAALYLTPSANTYDIKNNIFVNTSTSGASGRAVAFWKTTTGVANLSTSNNNIYYAGIPGPANLIHYQVATAYQTIEAYKAAVATIDQGSFTEMVPFARVEDPIDLHIDPNTPTRVEGNALPIAFINSDIDGDIRNATLPDIGADEGNFTAIAGAPGIPLLVSPANAAINLTLNTSLVWSASSEGGTPTSYDLNFGTTNPPSLLINLTGTTYSPTLAYSTTYYWMVSARNDYGSSDSQVFSFTTMADPTISAFPFTESFDDPAFPPAGWTNVRTAGAGTPGVWDRQTAGTYPTCTPYSGAGMIRYNSYSLSSGTKGELITPPLGIPANNIYQVKFWMFRDNGYTTYNNEVVNVYVNSSPTSTGGTLLGTVSRYFGFAPVEAVANQWYEYSFNIPASTGNNARHIIFEAVSQFGNNMFVDHITVRALPTGVPDHVVLSAPANNAIVDPAYVNLSWVPAETGGVASYYAVYASTDAETLFDELYFETPTTNFNLSAQEDVNLGYSTRWYWAVLPVNANLDTPDPESEDFMVWSFVTREDPAFVSFPQSENFDTVTVPNLPYGWNKITDQTGTLTTSTTTPHTAPNNVYMYNGATTTSNVILVTPEIGVNINTVKVSFWGRSGTAGTPVIIGTVNELSPTAVFTPIVSVPLTTTNAPYTVSLATYAGTDSYIAFKHGGVGTYRSIYLDTMEFSLLLAHDLAATAITAPASATAGDQVNVNVTVFNNGTMVQNAYTVKLMQVQTRTVLATLQVNQELAPDASAVHTLTWIPQTPGLMDIYGMVELANDQSATNNTTAAKTIAIFPQGTYLPYIGNPATTTSANNYPFNMFYKNNVAETIYLAQELQMSSGTIQAIVYNNNFTQALTKPVKIWMKNTTAANVSTAWLPFDGYTLVFDGIVDFPLGVNAVVIPLQTPFNYTGANLAVRTYRTWEDGYWASTNVWYNTIDTINPGRTRYHQIDGTGPLDPVQMLTFEGVTFTGTPVNNVANTQFIVYPAVTITSTDAPEVTITNVGVNAILNWAAVPYAMGYYVYVSDDPMDFPTTPTATVYTNTYSHAMGTNAKKFYKVSSFTYRGTGNRDDGIHNPAAALGIDNSKIKAEPLIPNTLSKD